MVDETGAATRDAFVSYSTIDRDIADAVVARLESGGVRCWIAPRDIEPGRDWSEAIPPAIDACRVFVLIFSDSSNESVQVAREVHIAQAGPRKLVIPFRVDATEPKGPLRYLLAGLHWLDATGSSRREKIGELFETVRASLEPSTQPAERRATPRIVAPNNVPAETNAFVGRDRELDDIKTAIAGHAVVSLVGTGGVGKTRLSLQVARETMGEFADGAWIADLSAIVDSDLVPSSIMDALGISETVAEDRAEALVTNLAAKRLLLVLDNCEQILDACTAIVARIVRGCPGVRVLCTTREPLGVAEEARGANKPAGATGSYAGRAVRRRTHRVHRREPVSRPRRRDCAFLARDRRIARCGSDDLPPAGRPAARARTGCSSNQRALVRANRGVGRPALQASHQGQPELAAAAADVECAHRMERTTYSTRASARS